MSKNRALGLCLLFFWFASIPVASVKAELVQADQPVAYDFGPWSLVTALAWSPDSRLLAAAAGNQVILLDSASLQVLASLEIGALSPALAISNDSNLLAIGSRDGWLRVWKIPQLRVETADMGDPLWSVEAHKKGINSLAFSRDGEWLATGGNDAYARLWQPQSGEKGVEIIGGSFAVPGIAFSLDGNILAVVNGDVVRLREVSTGRITGSLRGDYSLYKVAYSPDGSLLAGSDTENGVLVWDPDLAFRTGVDQYPEPIRLLHAGRSGTFHALVWAIAFSPDGKLIASAGGDGSVHLWNFADSSLVKTLEGHRRAVTSLAFSPDGRSLATGSLDGTLRIWDISK